MSSLLTIFALDIAETIATNARSLNATNILVNWTIPTTVSSQGVSSFSVSVSPECANGVTRGTTQTFPNIPETATMQHVGNLGESTALIVDIDHVYGLFFPVEPFVPYRVIVMATICDATVTLYNNVLFTQEGMTGN